MNSLLRHSHRVSNRIISVATRCIGTSQFRYASFKVQDDKDFLEKVENSKEPIIVDFFANWCGPCKALEPRLQNVIAQRKGQISLAKVDIDDLGELAAKYEVSTIPALVVFENGKAKERLIGLQDEDKLNLWIDRILKK
ncbi:thioredoxin, mitochondrial [Leptinotarsa decemlineata]|uniref:thioredoxin, mitochondrial n=1 Tax=Leptinotarsa decemlineata TaxID=7539 RepID=UPI000C25283B|nr:thioredoxin, mitochondrial-like [Leptinotarsa decemlineata]